MIDGRIAKFNRNEWSVIHAIFTSSYPTRQVVAGKTGMSLLKASQVIASLEAQHVVERSDEKRSTGGRPSTVYQLGASVGAVIGLSISPASIYVAVMDHRKATLLQDVIPLDLSPSATEHGTEILNQVEHAVRDLMRSPSLSGPISAIGVSLPGMVDTENGVWTSGLQIAGISHFPFARELQRKLQLPVFVDDVARSLALLEARQGASRELRHFVLLYLGAGMGTGLVIDHELYAGIHGLSGEIGHIQHSDNEYRCSCNSVGCLETVLSIGGLQRLFSDRLREGVHSTLQSLPDSEATERVSLDAILYAAQNGDRFTTMTMLEVGKYLGDTCAMLIKLFNPQGIVISGPLVGLRAYVAESVERTIQQAVLPEMLVSYQTYYAEYSPDQEPLSAAFMATERNMKNHLSGDTM